MHDPIDLYDKKFADELRKLQPLPPGQSNMDLWYQAGFIAARKQARRWHGGLALAVVGFSLFTIFHQSPAVSPQLENHVADIQVPVSTAPLPMPSLANVIENRRLLDDVLQDKWTPVASGGGKPNQPPIRVWMSDVDLKTVGVVQ